jgi:hypothetical protein
MTMRSPSEFAVTVQEPALDLCSAPAREPLVRRIWPAAMIALGIGLTVAWAGLLVFGFTKLVELVI